MARTVLELKCVQCETKFEKSFEKKRGAPEYVEGDTVRLGDSPCPNKCGGEWFTIEKEHPIRKFKRRY